MLKLGSLAQKIGKLLTALHHNGRLSPHRGNVPPATGIFNSENIRDNTAITRSGNTWCQVSDTTVAITVGGQPLGASDLQLIRRVDVSEAMYAQTQVAVVAASDVDNMIVNRGPLGLAELTEIEGLNPTMLSRVVGRLDSSVWSGSGAIRTITALPGSRSPPTWTASW